MSAIERSSSGRKSRVGETTGECAAVCCCCPCAVVNLLVLAVYRLPAGICRRKKRRKCLSTEDPRHRHRHCHSSEAGSADVDAGGEWDNEMCRRFYWGGFWRSDSRGHD